MLEVDTVSAAVATAGDSERITELLEVDTVLATDSTAGDSERIHGLLEVPQLAEIGGAVETAAHATAGDSEGIIGLRVSQTSFGMPSNSLNSSGCVAAVACARLLAVPGLPATASSSAFLPASLAVVAHARSTPMHGAHNSCRTRLGIQRVLVVCCLCADPPVTTWRWVGRVPWREGSMRMIIWECPKSTLRTLSQTREPGW